MIPKAEMIARVASVVERLRLCSAYCGREMIADVTQLEQALADIEEAHALTVDAYQAGLYRKHNVRPPELDVHGLSGRWNDRYVRHRHEVGE